jgi:phosphoglycerate dehydrogenase-like enzyme
MATISLPPKGKLTIGFAHAAYQLCARFAVRNTGIDAFEVRNSAALEARIGEADVLVVSGMWQNSLLAKASRLRFVQSISAGVNQYDQALFRAQGVRLASAQGVNEVAVAEHAMALMLGLRRHLHTARDNQRAKHWRPMIADIPAREDELRGKTLVIVGYGRIGQRLAKLAKAFDMHVVGLKRHMICDMGQADEIGAIAELPALLPLADVVVLTCPLTAETTGLIGAAAIGAMKRSALLINVARGAGGGRAGIDRSAP